MAAPACMKEDGKQAIFVGTLLRSGESVALCDECFVEWLAVGLSVTTGVDPTPFLAAIGKEPIDLEEPNVEADTPPDPTEDDGDEPFPHPHGLTSEHISALVAEGEEDVGPGEPVAAKDDDAG